MKKTFLLLSFAAAAFVFLPSCDSAQENRNEATEERMEEVEDAADDADMPAMEQAADDAADAAENRE